MNRSFFLFTISASIWLISFGLMNLLSQTKHAEYTLKSAYFFGITFIPIWTYQFSRALQKKNPNNSYVVWGMMLSTVTSLIMIFFSNTLTGINEYSWGRYPFWRHTEIAYLHFGSIQFLFLSFWIPALLNFIRHRIGAATPFEKSQSSYLLVGFLIAYTGWIDFFAAIGMPLYPTGYISITLFSCFIFYTIVKHQLLDIKIAFKRFSALIVIYAILLIISAGLLVPFAKQLLLNSEKNPLFIIVSVGTAMGLIFSLGPVIYAYLVRNSYWLRGHVTAGLAHELKSPLGVIESAALIAVEELSNPTINKLRMAEYLNLIQNNTFRLQNFVRDLLSVAKGIDDDINLQKETADISVLIYTVIETLKPLAQKKGLCLSFESSEYPARIEIDSGKIHQVLSNLISNAVKFSSQGTITVRLEKTKNDWLCSVEDEGIGIDSRHLPKIFDKFFQAHPGSKGTGIGLTIAKAWVETHGGKIWAESEGEGRGTTITFTLPANR